MAGKDIKIKTAFIAENIQGKTKLSVKIVAENTPTTFMIADETGFCEMILQDPKPAMAKNIQVKNSVRIVNAKLDLEKKSIIVDGTTSVFKSKQVESVEVPEKFVKLTNTHASTSAYQIPKATGDVMTNSKNLSEVSHLGSKKVISLIF